MSISIASLPGAEGGVLAGARLGRKVLGELVARVSTESAPHGLFLLDFADVDVATVSFLRESVLAFRRYCGSAGARLYPIVANPSRAVKEELHDFLKARSDAMLACRTNSSGMPFDPEVLGKLEDKQRQTLSMLVELGSATAPGLARDSDVGATAWNNRLAALVSRGIAMEERNGRLKTFRPVLEGIRHGS